VKAWREANPGYWRKPESPSAAQQTLPDQRSGLQELLRDFALQDTCDALQDSWNPQLAALLGILAWLRGSALQETIAADLREIMLTGYAILEELYPPAAPTPSPQHSEPN
jgi:hypothetical protein